MFRLTRLIQAICIVFVSSMPFTVSGQSVDEIHLAQRLVLPDSVPVYPLEKSRNEGEWVKNILFFSYKNFISSQDLQVCVFEPSCSVYAKHAVEKKGAVRGFCMSFDRLSRCHGLSARHYTRDTNSGLLHDPVK